MADSTDNKSTTKADAPVTAPLLGTTDVEFQNAEAQRLVLELLSDVAVSQGAHDPDREDSAQNDPELTAKARTLVEEEAAAATKEREEQAAKDAEQARKDREKAAKDAAKS